MKRLPLALILIVSAAAAVSAQAAVAFPGLTPEAKKELAAAKRTTPFALPTWLPAGFKISRVHANLGRRAKIEDKQLVIVYSRPLPNGKIQRFSIEAGFDGIGDLMYDGARKLRTGVGDVYLVYQPKDEDGNKMTDFAMTEWFSVGNVAYHYVGMYGSAEESGDTLAMISLADTERILRSLRLY